MGREVVEGWRRGEGWGGVWDGLLDVGEGGGDEGGDEGGEEGDRGVVLRARVRGDDVWGVERVVGALEGYERDELGGGELNGKGKGKGRVRLDVVVEDMRAKVDRPEEGEEMTVMAGWDGVGFRDDVW